MLDDTPLFRALNVVQLERGQLDQFCTMLNGPGCRISVAPFPFAWRMERVHDERYTGDECIRYTPGSNSIGLDPTTYTVAAFSGVRLTIPGTFSADPNKMAHQSIITPLAFVGFH